MWPHRKTTPTPRSTAANLQREVIDYFEFDSIYHAQMVIDRYYRWYNEREDTAHSMEKHPMPSTRNHLIQTLLNTEK